MDLYYGLCFVDLFFGLYADPSCVCWGERLEVEVGVGVE